MSLEWEASARASKLGKITERESSWWSRPQNWVGALGLGGVRAAAMVTEKSLRLCARVLGDPGRAGDVGCAEDSR